MPQMTVDKLLDSPNSTQLVYMYGYESKGKFEITSRVTTVQEPHSTQPFCIFHILKMAFLATDVKISIYQISGQQFLHNLIGAINNKISLAIHCFRTGINISSHFVLSSIFPLVSLVWSCSSNRQDDQTSACKESSVQQPRASGFCHWASELCS